jgi:hypothetical protein
LIIAVVFFASFANACKNKTPSTVNSSQPNAELIKPNVSAVQSGVADFLNEQIAEEIIPLQDSKNNLEIVERKKVHIKQFVCDEILNGNSDLFFLVERDYDFGRPDQNEIIKVLGEPLEVKIVKTFFIENGIAAECQHHIYDDFTLQYYVAKNESTVFDGFIIRKKLERLKTINIGDNAEKVVTNLFDKREDRSYEYIARWLEDNRRGKEEFFTYDLGGENEITFNTKGGVVWQIYVATKLSLRDYWRDYFYGIEHATD